MSNIRQLSQEQRIDHTHLADSLFHRKHFIFQNKLIKQCKRQKKKKFHEHVVKINFNIVAHQNLLCQFKTFAYKTEKEKENDVYMHYSPTLVLLLK